MYIFPGRLLRHGTARTTVVTLTPRAPLSRVPPPASGSSLGPVLGRASGHRRGNPGSGSAHGWPRLGEVRGLPIPRKPARGSRHASLRVHCVVWWPSRQNTTGEKLYLWHPQAVQPAKSFLVACTAQYIVLLMTFMREFWSHVLSKPSLKNVLPDCSGTRYLTQVFIPQLNSHAAAVPVAHNS